MKPWAAGLSDLTTLSCGRLVRRRGLRSGPVDDAAAPDFALYLTSRPHWESRQSESVAWPDVRLPRTVELAIRAASRHNAGKTPWHRKFVREAQLSL
ncbi:hypothetical protein GCM10009786_14240 [Leucobacter alluvii]|uniref:Uncharacterized protein n=1 Tax=Leucobacter alluvii TaxID=340321 RepID=A0ABP5N044_9MICO